MRTEAERKRRKKRLCLATHTHRETVEEEDGNKRGSTSSMLSKSGKGVERGWKKPRSQGSSPDSNFIANCLSPARTHGN